MQKEEAIIPESQKPQQGLDGGTLGNRTRNTHEKEDSHKGGNYGEEGNNSFCSSV